MNRAVRLAAMGAAVLGFVTAAVRADDDATFSHYAASIIADAAKAQSEFDAFSRSDPLLTAYAITLFGDERCETPPASDTLQSASGGHDPLTNTETGKKIFIVVTAVTSTDLSSEQETAFCTRLNDMVAKAESEAAGR